LLPFQSIAILYILGLDMGNGAKAQQKRERNAEKKSGPKSQMKINEAAKTIVCQTCKQPFLVTTRAPALLEHAQNKHSKTLTDCFPGVS